MIMQKKANFYFFLLSLKNNSLINSLTREGIWIVFGQISAIAASLYLVRFLTGNLNPSEYGRLALVMTISTTAGQIILGGIPNVTSRFYSVALEIGDFHGFLFAARRYAYLASIAVLLIALIVVFLLHFLGEIEWARLSLVSFLFSIVASISAGINALQTAARQRHIVVLHTILDAWLKIGFAYIFIISFGPKSFNVVLGYLFSTIIIVISQLYSLKFTIDKSLINNNKISNPEWLSKMWAFSWPFCLWGIFTGLHLASDRWSLEKFSTSHDVGLYAVVFQLGYTPVGVIVGFMISLLTPTLYMMAGDATMNSRILNVYKLLLLVSRICILFTMIGFVFSWFLRDWIFELFVSESYRKASIYFPWMILAGGFFATGQVLSLNFMTKIRSIDMLNIKVFTAVFGTSANVIGAYRFGVSGVVFSSLLFSILYFAWVYFVMSPTKNLK